MKYALDWSKRTHSERPDIFKEEIKNYADWKKQIETSNIVNPFEKTDQSNKESFLPSIIELSSSGTRDKLQKNLDAFFRYLEKA
ncbi:hypothetical protein [Bacillus ndiopicus]|uniref:hypothetical protein n=1 Tax=Bacillus ndiopicus TaxID=1347368 RepID=UPI0012B51AB6|nr:hypothetical protein [Bacillus ndiopicus]